MLTIAYSVQILGTRPCWGLLNPQIIIEVILWRASAIPNEAYEFIFGSHTFSVTCIDISITIIYLYFLKFALCTFDKDGVASA